MKHETTWIFSLSILIIPVTVWTKESLSALAIPITSSSTDVSRTLETDVSPTRPRTRSKLAGVGVVGWSGGVVAVGQGVSAPVGDAEHQQGVRWHEEQESWGGRHNSLCLECPTVGHQLRRSPFAVHGFHEIQDSAKCWPVPDLDRGVLTRQGETANDGKGRSKNTFSYSRAQLLTGSFWKVPDTDSWFLKWRFFLVNHTKEKHDF